MYEANNQPDADDSIRAKREYKRPDFQWGICDTNETNPERMDKFYTLEAKRLGSPSSSQWILNKNYILNGINRFILVEWGYGKSVSSGAMIGYIQNMELKEILNNEKGGLFLPFLSTVPKAKHGQFESLSAWSIWSVCRVHFYSLSCCVVC